MLSSVLVSIQEFFARFGVSTGTLIFVVAVTAGLSISMLTGKTAGIGVWFEDLMYRFGVSGR